MMARCLMMMMLVLSLTGCGLWREEVIEGENPWAAWEAAGIFWDETVDVPEVSRLVAHYAAHIYDKYRLELEDSAVLHNEEALFRFYLSFSSQRLLTLCEARLLLVEMVDEFIDRVNNHTVLSYQLNQFPLTADSIDLNVNFESFFGIYVDPLYIGKMTLWDSMSYFYAFNIKNPDADWSSQKFELFSKSRELAYAKQEAELPYSDKILRPTRLQDRKIERYSPYSPPTPMRQ